MKKILVILLAAVMVLGTAMTALAAGTIVRDGAFTISRVTREATISFDEVKDWIDLEEIEFHEYFWEHYFWGDMLVYYCEAGAAITISEGAYVTIVWSWWNDKVTFFSPANNLKVVPNAWGEQVVVGDMIFNAPGTYLIRIDYPHVNEYFGMFGVLSEFFYIVVEGDSIILTTADALAVLRHVAGIALLTTEQLAAYGISGTPTTGDALRILRIVAGL